MNLSLSFPLANIVPVLLNAIKFKYSKLLFIVMISSLVSIFHKIISPVKDTIAKIESCELKAI